MLLGNKSSTGTRGRQYFIYDGIARKSQRTRPSFAVDVHSFAYNKKTRYHFRCRAWIVNGEGERMGWANRQWRMSESPIRRGIRESAARSRKNAHLLSIRFWLQLLVCILIGLHYNSFNAGDHHTAMITMGTFGGYLIILVGLFIGSVMGTPVNRRVVCSHK